MPNFTQIRKILSDSWPCTDDYIRALVGSVSHNGRKMLKIWANCGLSINFSSHLSLWICAMKQNDTQCILHNSNNLWLSLSTCFSLSMMHRPTQYSAGWCIVNTYLVIRNFLPTHIGILIKISYIKANPDIYNQNLNKSNEIHTQKLFHRKYTSCTW